MSNELALRLIYKAKRINDRSEIIGTIANDLAIRLKNYQNRLGKYISREEIVDQLDYQNLEQEDQLAILLALALHFAGDVYFDVDATAHVLNTDKIFVQGFIGELEDLLDLEE